MGWLTVPFEKLGVPTECVGARDESARAAESAKYPVHELVRISGDGLDRSISRHVDLLIIDDSSLYREGLATIIAGQSSISSVRTAQDLASLHRVLEQGPPDVILLNLASINSGELLRSARERSPASKLIVLGVSEDDEEEIVACAEVGVAGYHLRSESLRQLLQLVGSVAAGGTLCSPRITALLLRRLSSLAAQQRPDEKVLALTTRENQILGLVAVGLSNREIADRLCIEVHTVKNHVHSVLRKLGVRRRSDAAAILHAVVRRPDGPQARVHR